MTNQAELLSLRQGSAALRDELQAARSEGAASALKAEAEAEARALAAKGAAESAVARHLEFIDRLLVDKQELSKRCEGLTEQTKAVESKYEAQLTRQEEGYAKELRRQRTLWTQAGQPSPPPSL